METCQCRNDNEHVGISSGRNWDLSQMHLNMSQYTRRSCIDIEKTSAQIVVVVIVS